MILYDGKSKNIRKFLRKYKEHIENICKKYDVKKLYLFGSAVEDIDKANDYDFALSGFPSMKFYEIWSKLDKPLDKDCHCIDLDLHEEDNHPFGRIIKKTGVIIYEQ